MVEEAAVCCCSVVEESVAAAAAAADDDGVDGPVADDGDVEDNEERNSLAFWFASARHRFNSSGDVYRHRCNWLLSL